jgi:ribose transport system substrate-binding protein
MARFPRFIALALGVSTLACSGGGGEKKDDSATPANTAAAPTAKGKKFTIAMIAKSSNNPVFLAARTGAEAAAKEQSARTGLDIQINWLTPPEEDGQVQAQRIQQAVNEGADVILISCSDAGKVTGAIDDAVNRGVPVMTFDSDAPQSRRFAFYGVDDIKTGHLVMAELAKLMNGKGKIAVLAGNQNAPNLQHRVQGVKEEAAKTPDIKILGVFNHVETPQDAAAEVVRASNASPDIQGWAMIGGWALFTPALVKDLDPKRVKIASVDALGSQLVYVDKGIAPVLLAQPVYQWGYVSVNTIIEHIHDKKDVPAIIPMELVRVTKDNLGEGARQLKTWGFTDVPAEYLSLK